MSSDNRMVVLLKSRLTLNRFYTLAPPERGWRNAEEIDDFPEDVLLGIAYPCLEDGLNDFAVIRSTFETLDMFPDDQALRDEFMIMVIEARDTLQRRLSELRDRLKTRQAHFLGTDLREFKELTINLVVKGNRRRTLDDMMKLDVYESVATVEAGDDGPEAMYHYEFLPENALEKIRDLPPLDFVVRIFDDVLTSADDEASYENKYTFDKHVFQKFIGLMFINYATTDPIFYGTKREDYEVSADRDMSHTPLYKAVSEALREIERQMAEHPDASEEDVLQSTIHERPSFGHDTQEAIEDVPTHAEEFTMTPAPVGGETPAAPTDEWGLDEPESAFEAPPFDLSSSSPTPTPMASPSVPPPATPTPPSAPSSPAPAPGNRMVELPGAKVAEQRLMIPINSILMATELLKNSSDPMAATYSQMIVASVEAVRATLKEWSVLEE